NETRVSERRVRFHYRVSGTMQFLSDVAQGDWSLVQLDHPPIVGYQLRVQAPGRGSEPFDAYVRRYASPEAPVVTLSPDRSVLTVGFERIPPGAGVEVNFLKDPALFEQRGRLARHQAALEEEMRSREESEG